MFEGYWGRPEATVATSRNWWYHTGDIGRIDEATFESGASYLVVDTGPWIFGRKVMLPAGVIERIDPAEKKVYVDRTKDQIKDAPEFDEMLTDNDDYRQSLGTYYTGTYPPM